MHLFRKGWIVIALAMSLGLGIAALYLPIAPRGAVQRLAWACALLSLFWSLMTFAMEWRRGRHDVAPGGSVKDVVWAEHCAALLFGVVAAIIQSVVLVMRFVYVGIDIVHGYPWRGMRGFGFDATGSWTLCTLSAACAIGLAATRDRRLATCQFWTLVMLAAWTCLLTNPYRATVTGGYERTDATLLLTVTLSGLLVACVIVTGWLGDCGFFADRHVSQAGEVVEADAPPGFRASVTAVALALTPAACYHLLVPVGASSGGFRMSAAGAGGAAAIAALGCFLLLRRSWGYTLADAAMGLTSMAICGAAMLFMPSARVSLAEQYPIAFSAIIVGAAVATGLWAHLACSWRELDASDGSATVRRLLVPHAQRFAFLCSAIALLAGTLMMFWPRLPGIAAMDHSLGRVASGFGANLFLLLVTLSCSRRLGRTMFQVLAVLAAVSTAGFLFMRMLPFASDLS
jgi:hypothetical protein